MAEILDSEILLKNLLICSLFRINMVKFLVDVLVIESYAGTNIFENILYLLLYIYHFFEVPSC